MNEFRNKEKVVEIFKNKYKSLFKAEKKVADFIIANPNKASLLNVKEIASEANVSDATVVRMCQHCGFEGFYQMKILLLRDLNDDEFYNIEEAEGNPIESFLNRKKSLIETINTESNINRIKKLVNLLLESNNVIIAATGNTIPIALDLEFRLNRAGIKAFTSTSNERLLNFTSNAGIKDILINISKSGLSKSVLKISEVASRNSLKKVCITSEENSSLAESSDIIIFSGKLYNDINDSFNGLESHVGEIIINDIIIAFLISTRQNKNELIKSRELEYEFFSSLKI